MKEGWEYKTLGEVGSFKRGGNFSKKDFVKDGFPCIHYGQIHTKFGIFTEKHLSCVPANIVKKERCAKKGDLVIAITSEDEEGSCKCTAWMADYEAYVGGHTAIYSHTLNPLFMSYYFKSPIFQIEKLNYTHGFKVVEISPKDIAKIKIPIPSLEEQRRIVSYLDSSFKLIDEIKNKALKSLTEAKALFQSALAEAMEPKEEWEEKTLGECCDKINGLWKGKKPPFIYVGVIRNANFTKKMTLDFSNIEYLDVEVKQYNSRKLKRGDLIIEKSGGSEKQPVGRAVLFLKGDGEYSFSNFTSVLRIKNNEELNYYFLYYFLLYIYQRGDTKTMQKATTGIHNIEFEKYLNIKIPIMSLNEQRRIVSYLDKLSSKVRAIEEKYQKMVEECDALKQAMLRDVFE